MDRPLKRSLECKPSCSEAGNDWTNRLQAGRLQGRWFNRMPKKKKRSAILQYLLAISVSLWKRIKRSAMSYYAALVSLIQLLKETLPKEKTLLKGRNHRADHRYYHESLDEKLSSLQAVLKDYSPENKQVAVRLENRITDLAYEAQDIIETRISGLEHEVYFEEKLEEVKRDVGSLVEVLMRIKENRKSHEDNDYANSTDGASTQAAVPKDGISTVRSCFHFCAGLVSNTILRLERKSRDIPPHYVLFKEQIYSLIEVLSHFRKLLLDYSPKDIDDEAANSLKIQIKNTIYQGDHIITSRIYYKSLKSSLLTTYIERLDKMNREADSIATELLMSTEAPSDGTTSMEMEFHEQLTINAQPYGESSELEAVPIVGMERFATNEDNLQENHCSENSAGPSTQAPIIDCTARTSKVQASSDRSTMVGFDENLNAIKEQLCGEPPKLQVVSIVGMGGIGKTTWAKNIFNAKLIYEHFDCCAWVVVSQDYHLRNILLAIASSFNKNDIEELRGVEEEILTKRIYQYFYGRRYLIIMDDVWHKELLDDLKMIIPDNHNGSRIMITTRQSDVALYGCCTSRFTHQIPLLNEYQSWNLFCQSQKVSYPPIPENIGRSIAKKCRGLPLAIVVVAGLLSKAKLGRLDWEEIERGVSSIAENDVHFSKILSLSYNFLPHHLKPCFLYLGGFPEDCQIHASLLIKIWIAEGFVEPTESKSMEEVAEVYLEDLVSRNLVLISKKKSSGKIKYCGIHDLLRDLCLRISSYENFLHVLDKNSLLFPKDIRNVRRLHIGHTDPFLCLDQMKEHSRSVRSIYSFADVGDGFLSVVSDFKFLRVLNAVDTRSSTSPDEIVELLHLRYLKLLYLPITPSIWKLQKLQTLVLGGETILPSEIWKMPHLRHVIIPRMTLPPIPRMTWSSIESILYRPGERISDGVPLLGKLQTLSTVMDFIFTSKIVEMIPSLTKLQVFYNEAYKSWDAFGLNNLVHLTQLQTLNIEFSLGENNVDILVGPLPLNFAFPENLKTLSLSGCRLPWSDMTVVGSLPNIEVLKLRLDAFLGEDWETIEGEFPKLKFLLMEKLFYLEYWRVENTHFPCLEHLIIRDCGRLQEIPSEIGDIPTLELIEAYGSKLAADSALRIKAEQCDNGNDDLQVCIG